MARSTALVARPASSALRSPVHVLDATRLVTESWNRSTIDNYMPPMGQHPPAEGLCSGTALVGTGSSFQPSMLRAESAISM